MASRETCRASAPSHEISRDCGQLEQLALGGGRAAALALAPRRRREHWRRLGGVPVNESAGGRGLSRE